MSRLGVINTLADLLTAIASPFGPTLVYKAEPLSIPTGDRALAFWYLGDELDSEQTTFGRAHPYEIFMIRCYWRVQVDAAVREDLELEVWNMTRAIKAAVRSDLTLAGNCQDIKVSDAETGYVFIGGSNYRSVQVVIAVLMADQEELSP